MSIRIHSYSLLCLLFFVATSGLNGQARGEDPFLAFVRENVGAIPAHGGAYVPPTDRDLDGWAAALNLFRAGKTDSCRAILAEFGYTLTAVRDAVSGNTFDVFREAPPVRRGWGTLLFNRAGQRRINVHVNHPVDDGNIPVVAAELFRRAGAKWLLVGGSSRNAVPRSRAADIAIEPRTVFQHWHALVSDPTIVSLSLHAYNPENYEFPISASDVVLSNGRTTDLQWGISQISLSFRDSLRTAGFRTALAMLDSGFARLAGGANPQGLHTNDGAGFGRWMNVELSTRVRYTPREYLRFIAAAERALAVTGQPLARESGQAFGLVSPRVVKIDRANKLLFPPASQESYRIISFGPGKSRNDTLDLLFGNWRDGARGREMARIVEYDTAGSITRYSSRGTVTRLVTPSPGKYLSGIRPVESASADSAIARSEESEETREPIQVHRIPLKPVLASTVSPEYEPVTTPFHWGVVLPEGFSPQVFTYTSASRPDVDAMAMPGLSRFLIPLLRNSYENGGTAFVGVDMTEILVNEIARLVSEYRVEGREIGLMAERGDDGDYYLRLFPGIEPGAEPISSNLP